MKLSENNDKFSAFHVEYDLINLHNKCEMKKIYNHSVLEGLTESEKKVIWNLYKAKYSGSKWGFTFCSLLVGLVSLSLITILILDNNIENLFIHQISWIIFFGFIGLGGSFLITGLLLLRKRIQDFHEYLEEKELNEVILDLKDTTSKLP